MQADSADIATCGNTAPGRCPALHLKPTGHSTSTAPAPSSATQVLDKPDAEYRGPESDGTVLEPNFTDADAIWTSVRESTTRSKWRGQAGAQQAQLVDKLTRQAIDSESSLEQVCTVTEFALACEFGRSCA